MDRITGKVYGFWKRTEAGMNEKDNLEYSSEAYLMKRKSLMDEMELIEVIFRYNAMFTICS